MNINTEYYFYGIADKQKEAIGIAHANSLEEAIEMFSIQKALKINEFKKIYIVAKRN